MFEYSTQDLAIAALVLVDIDQTITNSKIAQLVCCYIHFTFFFFMNINAFFFVLRRVQCNFYFHFKSEFISVEEYKKNSKSITSLELEKLRMHLKRNEKKCLNLFGNGINSR